MSQRALPGRLSAIKHVLVVLSGKGGVGKSSVATQLALSLYQMCPTASIGVLDVDLTGPSIPRMLAVDGGAIRQGGDGWIPVTVDGDKGRLSCMSVGFLLKSRDDSVVWRGPKKNAMIRQFLLDVKWDSLDYLVVDTPPGTSDEHLSLIEHLSSIADRISSVLVATPQALALNDVMKCLSFTRTTATRVLGLIENMSGFVCPCCGESSNVFSTGGGESLAHREGLEFLGRLPIDVQLVELLDNPPRSDSRSTDTFPLLKDYLSTPSYSVISGITRRIIDQLTQSQTTRQIQF